MAKIFVINDASITGGVASTSDLGTSSLTWKDGYLSGTLTVGTVSATGNGIFSAKVSAASGSFTALLTAGTASISGAIIGGANGSFATIITAASASLTANLIVSGTSSLGNITFADNRTILVGTGTGLTIATGTNQLLGHYGITAVVQPSATGETVGFTANAGTTATDQSTWTGNVGTTAYRISDVVKALKNLGFLKQ